MLLSSGKRHQVADQSTPLESHPEDDAQISARGLSKKDAEAWVKATKRLQKKLGRPVRPADYPEFAQTKEGLPIRHLFIWDDTEAAKKYREHQAAFYCRIVRVVVSAGDAPVRAIVRVVDVNEKTGYVPVSDLATNDSYREQVLSDAARDLRSFKGKFEGLNRWLNSDKLDSALTSIGSAIDALG
jgi:hypothetical protein